MKKTIFTLATLCLMALTTVAQDVVTGVEVNDFKLVHSGDYMTIDMSLNVEHLKLKRNRAVLLTPCLINNEDSLHLRSIGVYGRRRYLYYKRNYGDEMLSGKDEMVCRKGKLPTEIAYHEVVPYEDWMNGMDAQLHKYLYGCCGHIMNAETGRLGDYKIYVPEYLYVTPVAEVKTRTIEGSSYIDFPVDKTTIYPNYHNNTNELGKILETINAVADDQNVVITNLWLKGYASPESSYSHNRDLAIGRVNAIKNYVQGLYDFPDSIITTEYEPENWEGLKKYVEFSSLEHKAEILAIIDNDIDPDKKEAEIKRIYPREYKFLLQNCYPYLRRTDYRVNYIVKSFTQVEEIKEILRSEPSKLSLNELYLVAQSCEPGSEEFNEVFETAVRLFPDDPVANINAANTAMKRGDLALARKYLDRAGDSPEAEHAREILSQLLFMFNF